VRLYADEDKPEDPIPERVTALGPTAREIVIRRHNRIGAEAFIAEALADLPALVDAGEDDTLVDMSDFVAAVRSGLRGRSAPE
jgi:hypothetical protein